jgi:hypothetical protein
MEALVDRCLADYDENGWRAQDYYNGEDVSILGRMS